MLTQKQHSLLMFIYRQTQATGVAPSFDEMKDALGLKSKSGVHRLVKALDERGFIRRLPHRARAIEVLRVPGDVAGQARGAPEKTAKSAKPAPSLQSARSKPRLVGGAAKSNPPETPPTPPPPEPSRFQDEVVALPVIGRIAAGAPTEALESSSATMGVPANLLRSGGAHFALEVRGDSMTGAGILDGDLAIIQSDVETQNGDIVVALIAEESEATLKRLRRRGGSVALEAANPEYATKIYSPDQVRIQGRMVGLMRRY